VSSEISTLNDGIFRVTGKKPSILRCPYGDHDESLLKIAKEQGMKAVVNWNYDSKRIL
jgi:peptidoglycan/xylan/chitin deacetylase (PgdA/CDA1 family)